ncbi:MAG TPA: hypothetical protein VMU68_04375 [Acidimicrobiales bacterium]|nr:hypothetical protein [Acidimicrobiales bacterium]
MHDATWLTIHDPEVFVQVAGPGVPVVCVHPAGQSRFQCLKLLQRMSEFGYRVVVIDLPGHGRSMSDAASPSQGDRSYSGTFASRVTALASEKGRLVADIHRREDSIVTSVDVIVRTTHEVTEGRGARVLSHVGGRRLRRLLGARREPSNGRRKCGQRGDLALARRRPLPDGGVGDFPRPSSGLVG